MVVTFIYFHAATSTVSGTLPSTMQQSAVTTTTPFDAVTVNRTMSITQGTSQTSLAATVTPTSSPTQMYITRFVSPTLAAQTISAQSWFLGDATSVSATGTGWPNAQTSGNRTIALYVWRPSTGARVGYIINGVSAAPSANTGGATGEKSSILFYSGSSVVCQAGDVLCLEMLGAANSGASHTFTWYYDGTSVDGADNTTETSQASFIEAGSQTITFTVAPTVCTVTGKTITPNKFVTVH